MFLFFSVARSQEIGSWERAAEATQQQITTASESRAKSANKATAGNPGFGMNMPMMSSAFDTAMWLSAA